MRILGKLRQTISIIRRQPNVLGTYAVRNGKHTGKKSGKPPSRKVFDKLKHGTSPTSSIIHTKHSKFNILPVAFLKDQNTSDVNVLLIPINLIQERITDEGLMFSVNAFDTLELIKNNRKQIEAFAKNFIEAQEKNTMFLNKENGLNILSNKKLDAKKILNANKNVSLDNKMKKKEQKGIDFEKSNEAEKAMSLASKDTEDENNLDQLEKESETQDSMKMISKDQKFDKDTEEEEDPKDKKTKKSISQITDDPVDFDKVESEEQEKSSNLYSKDSDIENENPTKKSMNLFLKDEEKDEKENETSKSLNSKTKDKYDEKNLGKPKKEFKNKNKQIATPLPDDIESQIKELSIKGMKLAFEMDMTNIRDVLTGKTKNIQKSIIPFDKKPLPGDDAKENSISLMTDIEMEPLAKDSQSVPLQLNATIKGLVYVDSDKFPKDQIKNLNVPEFNEYVTAIAANLCSKALQKGFPTNISKPQGKSIDSIEEKKNKLEEKKISTNLKSSDAKDIPLAAASLLADSEQKEQKDAEDFENETTTNLSQKGEDEEDFDVDEELDLDIKTTPSIPAYATKESKYSKKPFISKDPQAEIAKMEVLPPSSFTKSLSSEDGMEKIWLNADFIDAKDRDIEFMLFGAYQRAKQEASRLREELKQHKMVYASSDSEVSKMLTAQKGPGNLSGVKNFSSTAKKAKKCGSSSSCGGGKKSGGCGAKKPKGCGSSSSCGAKKPKGCGAKKPKGCGSSSSCGAKKSKGCGAKKPKACGSSSSCGAKKPKGCGSSSSCGAKKSKGCGAKKPKACGSSKNSGGCPSCGGTKKQTKPNCPKGCKYSTFSRTMPDFKEQCRFETSSATTTKSETFFEYLKRFFSFSSHKNSSQITSSPSEIPSVVDPVDNTNVQDNLSTAAKTMTSPNKGTIKVSTRRKRKHLQSFSGPFGSYDSNLAFRRRYSRRLAKISKTNYEPRQKFRNLIGDSIEHYRRSRRQPLEKYGSTKDKLDKKRTFEFLNLNSENSSDFEFHKGKEEHRAFKN